ncbi:MAG TPA: hypothetical protein VGL38_00595 [bacterium]
MEKPVTIDEKLAEFQKRRTHADLFREEIISLKKAGERRESNPQLNSMIVFVEDLEKDIRGQISKIMSFAGSGTGSESAEEVGMAIEMAYRLANAGWGAEHNETKRLGAMAALRG